MAVEGEVDLDSLVARLPDPHGAKVFLARFGERWPTVQGGILTDGALLSRVLTLAAYSPFLSEVMLSCPQDIDWLDSQRRWFDTVKSRERLSEDLARFAARPVVHDPQKVLVDFKHREYLRIYLRDCLGLGTLSEVTEELSNLADLIIGKALSIAETEISRAHGYPLSRDEKGRITRAELAVIALGKLGCRELNYASDIDLFFVFSGNGETSGAAASVRRASKGSITNKEFFTRVAERVVDLTGGIGEGGRPVYRVDLRLRPYGRDGDLVWPVENAVSYYHGPARVWERQALIRARASAGSAEVARRFVSSVESAVFQVDAVEEAVADIARMRERTRQNHPPGAGFNVKLGRGGIRDVEFITQALQLRFGAREHWIRPAQMLIVLARLSEKGYLSKSDRTVLSAAYTFLRTVEHRVQMDQGAQTHSVPTDREQLRLLARRCGYVHEGDPTASFIKDLKSHTAAVSEIYDRIMSSQPPRPREAAEPRETAIDSSRLVRRVAERFASVLSRYVSSGSRESNADWLGNMIANGLERSINATRALRNLGMWVEALATASDGQDWDRLFTEGSSDDAAKTLEALIAGLTLTLPCHYLSGILLSRPSLAFAFADDDVRSPLTSVTQVQVLLDREIGKSRSIADKAESLRRSWYPVMLTIGYRDLASTRGRTKDGGVTPGSMLNPRQNNLEQTYLGEATLREAVRLALESTGLDAARAEELPLAVLGLGRLGHVGMDYGSDLDLLIIYDDAAAWPGEIGSSGPGKFASDFAAELVRILSSITREGTLYRVDLRLRPEGSSGQIACSLAVLESYILNRASAWEHSAYLKVREVAANLGYGELTRERLAAACFEASRQNANLNADLRQMRDRLQKEKAKNNPRDIKWGRGGMTDVYFVTRYLQLKHSVYVPPEQGTLKLIEHLGSRGLITADQTTQLYDGYLFLRRLDHWIRLLSDRPSSLLPASMVVLEDIARVLGLEDADALISEQASYAVMIRAVFDEVFA